MKTMLRVLLKLLICAILCFGLLLTPAVYAEDTVVDSGKWYNLYWKLDENGLLTISGNGEMTGFNFNSSEAWKSYRSSIKSVAIEEGVTSIGSYAFYSFYNLKTITIPSSLKSIGTSAIYSTGLTDIFFYGTKTQWSAITIDYSNIFARNIHYCTSGTWGENISWTLDCDGLLTISGMGDMDDFMFASEDAWLEYRNDIYLVEIEAGITSIGKESFSNCERITRVIIPASVTSIRDYAFYYCDILSDILIPNSVTSIGRSVFNGCYSLSSIIIPSSVTSIGYAAFFDCSSLSEVYYGGTSAQWGEVSIGDANSVLCNAIFHFGHYRIIIEEIKNGNIAATLNGEMAVTAMEGDVISLNLTPDTGYVLNTVRVKQGDTDLIVTDGTFTMPASEVTVTATFVSEIIDSGICGNNLTWTLYVDGKLVIGGTGTMVNYSEGKAPWFENRLVITSIGISEGVSSIGSFAFYGCNSMTSVAIPETVSSIGKNAFYGCSSLTDVTIPLGVTSISDYTFYGCNNLTDVTIPEGVTRIGDLAFYGCSGLTSVIIPESVASIGNGTFYGCSSLVSVAIPEEVSIIGVETFRGCSSLTSVTISEGVTWIGDSAFSGCSSLVSVIIPEGVTNISGYAFSGCSDLLSVTIPKSIRSIGGSAFSGCNSLTDVYYKGTKAQWNAISIGGGNVSLKSASIHYSGYTLSINSNTIHGTVSAEKDIFSVDETVILTIIPDIGYELDTLIIKQGETDVSETNNTFKMPEGDVTVTALFKPIIFTITWKNDDDSVIDTTSVEYGTVPTHADATKAATAEYTYSFAGWTPEVVAVTGEATYKAMFNATKNSYTITWLNDDDSVIDTTTVEYGTIPTHANASKAATAEYTYSFAGWMPEIVVVTGEVTYKATFTAIPVFGTPTFILPHDIKAIEESAFESLPMTIVDIPNGCESIGKWAFRNCTGLIQIRIPASVTLIDETAFAGCENVFVYGAASSRAETCAKVNGFTFIEVS